MTAEEAEDRRTHRKYRKATGEAISFPEYLTLRQYWRTIGGEFFGPNIEHGSMPESKLLPHLRVLCESRLVRLQYIGAVALLGRLTARISNEDDLECIHQAMLDCVSAFPGQFKIVRTGGSTTGSWSLEPVP